MVKELLVSGENIHISLPDFQLDVPKFSVARGELVAVRGPNGSGKSVFLQTVAGRIHQYTGEINHFTTEFNSDTPDEIIGYMDNHANYIEEMTVIEALKFCSFASTSWNNTVSLSLGSIFKIDTNKKIGTLSSGNRAKLSIIIALSQDSKLLILDEPFAFLDEGSRVELVKVLVDQKQESRGMLISSHDFSPLEGEIDCVIDFQTGTGIYNDKTEGICHEIMGGSC